MEIQDLVSEVENSKIDYKITENSPTSNYYLFHDFNGFDNEEDYEIHLTELVESTIQKIHKKLNQIKRRSKLEYLREIKKKLLDLHNYNFWGIPYKPKQGALSHLWKNSHFMSTMVNHSKYILLKINGL